MRHSIFELRQATFIFGLFSICSAYLLVIGSVNIRIYELGFYFFAVSILLRLLQEKKVNFKFIIFYVLLLLFVTLTMFSILEYNDLYQRYAFLYYSNKVLPIIIYGLCVYFIGKDALDYFFKGLVVICFIGSIFVIIEYIEILRGTYTVSKTVLGIINVDQKKLDFINQGFIRPSGFAIDPNFMAGYCGLCVFYLFSFSSKGWFNKLKKWLIVLPMLFSVFALLSRTAIFSTIITLGIVFLLSIFGLYRNRSHSLYQFMFFCIVIVVCVFINVVITQPELLDSVIRRFSVSDGSANQRLEYIEYYLSHNSLISMFIGGGPYSSGYLLGEEFFGNDFIWAPESAYLSIFIDYGIVGLFFFLSIIIACAIKLYLNKDNYFPVYVFLCVMPVAYNFMGDRVFLYLITVFAIYTLNYNRFSYDKS
ncbi:TPA: O-antigen ligase family protein [Photobacterium damselae]